MADEITKKRLEAEVDRLNRKFGHKTGSLGSEHWSLNVVPTGILALDYALGTGGWPLGYVVEVFGPPDIGKSSVIGFNAIKSAQAMGKTCGIIAVEPGFEKEWAVKNGVNPDLVIVARPDTGDDAFTLLHDWVTGDVVDYIVFDSIGAVLKAAETEAQGKPMQGGQSNLITWGIKRILTPTWKNNKGVMLLNQIRADMNARVPGQYDSPGGNALKHSCSIRVQLRPGRERDEVPMGSGNERHQVIVGRQLIAIIKRNKHTEGTNKRAVFNYYQMDTEDKTVGIDKEEDVLNTALKTGVIERGGSYYSFSEFPEGRIQSKDAVKEFLNGHPEVVEKVRDGVIDIMLAEQRDKEGRPQVSGVLGEQERTSQEA